MPYKIKGKCIYKKDTDSKIGCTKRDVKKYLNALHANVDENRLLIKSILRNNLAKVHKRNRFINESHVNGKTIINVDIQPEYAAHISFNINNWVQFINSSINDNRLVFLFNGEDTLGMINEMDYKMWLMELGIEEEVIEESIFYDKGYAFFRYCMDSGIDENSVADLVKFMIKHDINDSRMLDSDMWNLFMEETNNSIADVRDLLENADDMISIPDLMDFIGNYNNIILLGGGVNECLKEVEIALIALNKPFNIFGEFTY